MSFTNQPTCSHSSPRGYFTELPCGHVSLSMFPMEDTIGYISRCFNIWFSHSVVFVCFVVSVLGAPYRCLAEKPRCRGKAPTSPWIPGLEESSQAAHELRNFLAPFLCLSAFVGQALQNALPDSMREGDPKVVLCNPQLHKAVLIELP